MMMMMMQVSLAWADSLYLASSMFVFAVPLLWPGVAHTFLFTHLITLLLPTAHIGINGKNRKLSRFYYFYFSQVIYLNIS